MTEQRTPTPAPVRLPRPKLKPLPPPLPDPDRCEGCQAPFPRGSRELVNTDTGSGVTGWKLLCERCRR